MIGSVVRQQVSPASPKISTKLRDVILADWREDRDALVPTLASADLRWQEFWLYASGTKNWCPRMFALSALSKDAGKVSFGAETLWNFDQGHAYHDLFQNRILPRLKGVKLFGGWKKENSEGVIEVVGDGVEGIIPSGDNVIVERDAFPSPGEGWTYTESKVRMLNERIVIKVDGILVWGDGTKEIFELKTESEDARDSLNPMLGGSARAQHIEQVMLAMHATGIHKARIVYMFKGARSVSMALMEHEVSYDEALAKDLMRRAMACVDAVAACDRHKADNEDWPKLLEDRDWFDEQFKRLEECPMKSKGKARYCSMRDECFPGRGKQKSK